MRTAVLAVAVFVCSIAAATARAGGPLQTAVYEPNWLTGADGATEMNHVVAAGASIVRIRVRLREMSPGGTTKPAAFDPTNPADPAYDWSTIDAEVIQATAAGLQPMLFLYDPPQWACGPYQLGCVTPSSFWFGKFAEGAARRYSGTFDSLPRVRYWGAYNEPNIGLYVSAGGSAVIPPDAYRQLVNAFARGVKRVEPDNLVVAGELAPYASLTGAGVPPLTYMQRFLCLTGARIRPRPSCVQRVNFDIWAMNPYTWGGPTHQASTTTPGDVGLGDLPAMRSALDQAAAAGRIVSNGPVQFWATEFSWDTNPPDPAAIDMGLATRWTAEALYRMWQSGVSLVTWYLIRDQPPPPADLYQSGLYFRGATVADDAPKPIFESFRFPTVAFVESGGIRVWCRTPAGLSGLVTFQQNSGSGWTPIATLSTDGNGIATAVIPTASTAGSVQAVFTATGETSNAFSLTPVPDQVVNPFGS